MGSVEDMQSCFSFNVWNFQAEHTRQKRKNLTQEHLDLLTEEYNKNHKPTKETFQRLTALIPGITEKSIKIWYQNRRSKLSMTKKRNQKKSEKVSASCIALFFLFLPFLQFCRLSHFPPFHLFKFFPRRTCKRASSQKTNLLPQVPF